MGNCCNACLAKYCTDSKGYLVDEEGFDYMKISFLRDIKAQQRSLRYWPSALFITFRMLFLHVICAEITPRPMLDLSTMMKQNHGMKGVMLHFLVLPKMKSTNLMPLVWLIQVVVY